ncbi:uncharacterized protein DUF2017 [Glaciihabitans tibetensis]|uniref:Uncharacterized protein DUF2017 n=1 Tax=Glaciihabitans tibetensis TaxID=1266600 RepID=A0A2T0VIL5_9MICO|nr:DUF2017 family protein [Glaciihabitans tibetensis]PRY70062.1 uncharacterized protein DUF2017 [Glaciihabitans tibetensis]
MNGFAQSSAGTSTASFSAEEARILSDLVGQLADLIERRGAPGADPALDRLLPAGYRDSEQDAAEFRRFTESDLADAKVRNARAVLLDLSRPARNRKQVVELDGEGLGAWLRTLTDLRLTLGARLAVERDGTMPSDADPMTVAIYEWLGFLQETLVESTS